MDELLDALGINFERLMWMRRLLASASPSFTRTDAPWLLRGRPGPSNIFSRIRMQIRRSAASCRSARFALFGEPCLKKSYRPLARGFPGIAGAARAARARRLLEGAPKYASALLPRPVFDEKIDGEEHEPLVRPPVLKNPKALLGSAQGFFLAALRQAELGELQIAPRRGKVLGAQSDAHFHIAVALGKEMEDGTPADNVRSRICRRSPIASAR